MVFASILGGLIRSMNRYGDDPTFWILISGFFNKIDQKQSSKVLFRKSVMQRELTFTQGCRTGGFGHRPPLEFNLKGAYASPFVFKGQGTTTAIVLCRPQSSCRERADWKCRYPQSSQAELYAMHWQRSRDDLPPSCDSMMRIPLMKAHAGGDHPCHGDPAATEQSAVRRAAPLLP